MRVDDTKNYKRDNPVSMTRRIQNTEILLNQQLHILLRFPPPEQ